MLLEDLSGLWSANPQPGEGLDHPLLFQKGHENAGFLTIGHLDVFDLQSEAPALVVYCNLSKLHLQGQQWCSCEAALEFQTVPDAIHSDQAEKGHLERVGQVFTSKTTMPSLRNKKEEVAKQDVKSPWDLLFFIEKNF